MASVSSELKKYTVTRQLFLGNDSTPISGSMLKQKSLARTLQKISKDKGKSFYQGKKPKD